MKLRNLFLLSLTLLLFSCGNNKTDPASTDVAKPIETPQQLKELNDKILNDPNNPELYHSRAKYFIETKDFEAALNDMGRVMKIDSSKASYCMTLADVNFYLNRTGTSKMYFEKAISIDPKNTEAMLKLAQLYLYVNKNDKSIEYINMALKTDQYNARAYFMKGMNYKMMGDTAKAVSSMQTAVEQNNDYYDAYMQLGVIHAAQKNPLAVDYYNNALRIDPKSTEALYDKAKFFHEINDDDNAIATYNQLLKAEPAHMYGMFNLGVIYLENKNDADKALKYFDDAIHTNSHYAEAYCGRGRVYEMKKQIPEAINDYKKCLELKPNFELALHYLSRLEKK